MDFNNINNWGSSSTYWTTAFVILLCTASIVAPIILFTTKMIEQYRMIDQTPLKVPAFVVPYHYLYLLAVSVFITVTIWSSYGPGRELDIYDAEDDGFQKQTTDAPEETPEEIREVEAKEWKSPTQVEFQEKIKTQESGQSALEAALERAQKRKGEKE